MNLVADLHLHSCLSPCGGLDMAPAAMARAARAAGLQVVALTDHNSARNTPAFHEACRVEGLHALCGLEVTTTEEIHVLCLFAEPGPALLLGEEVYARLPFVPNRPGKTGDQVVVDVDERILDEVPKYLGVAADWTLSDLGSRVRDLGGLWIPAHVNRPVFSLLSQLGRIPDLPYDALEVTPGYDRGGKAVPGLECYPLITGSDAHCLADIGRHVIGLHCERCSLSALRRALPDATLLFTRRVRQLPQHPGPEAPWAE